MSKKTAAVIGVGVIGLSTAILALERGYNVTIYSDKPPMETTSLKAAAYFKPYAVAHNDLTQRMLEIAWGYYEQLVSQYGDALGVRKHVHWEAMSLLEDDEDTSYLDVMEEVTYVEQSHVPGGYAFGRRYRTFLMDTPIFLPWLLQRFTEAGGTLVLLDKKFNNLGQLAELATDVVFNCTGLGARELCHDEAMIPIKGQIVIVDPQPSMDWSIRTDDFYIVPRKYDTVLGGTAEWHVNDETVEPETVDRIIQGNKPILPHLNLNSVRRTYAGLRPYRTDGIRLESQEVNGKQIVHNYGHGGAGLTLCWGSAYRALQLV